MSFNNRVRTHLSHLSIHVHVNCVAYLVFILDLLQFDGMLEHLRLSIHVCL